MQRRVISVIRQRDAFNDKLKRVQPPIPKVNSGIVVKQVNLNSQARKVQPVRSQQPLKIVPNNSRFIRNVKENVRPVRPIVKDSNYTKIMNLRNSCVGQNLVMIACGPSVNEVDFTPLKGINNLRIMVINKPIDSIWPADYWAFCDHSQYVRNKQAFESYNGMVINSIGVKAMRPNQVQIKALHGKGFSRDLSEGYYIGRSSVYANMQTALFMCFSKIFIFGVDMCAINGKTHHYGNGFNPDVAADVRIQRFAYEAEHYTNASNTLLEETRKKFYFCSSYNPWPFTEKFNKWDHKTAVGKILEMVKQKQ